MCRRRCRHCHVVQRLRRRGLQGPPPGPRVPELLRAGRGPRLGRRRRRGVQPPSLQPAHDRPGGPPARDGALPRRELLRRPGAARHVQPLRRGPVAARGPVRVHRQGAAALPVRAGVPVLQP
uniref:Uncharacterized protein n=1 Tax=Arundo donax TaxID=35708 RepID=A0A0A9GF34_ARUDO